MDGRFFESLKTPQGVSGILTMVGAIVATLIASINIRKYKEHKSYDLFTVKRLKTYDCILKAYQELMYISSVDYINMATSLSYEKYLAEYEILISKFNGLLSTTEEQECFLLHECRLLHKAVKDYIELKTAESEQTLIEQRNKVNYFMDIYIWTLWNYIQRLHKKNNEDKYHKLFDKQFEKIFKESQKLNKKRTDLFKCYQIDEANHHLYKIELYKEISDKVNTQ